MAISKRLRYEVFRRDGYTCRYCGRSVPEVKLTVDHVVPDCLGGGDEPSNLVTACADCNAGKSATPPDAPLVDNVAQDALRWAQAIKAAADAMLADQNALGRAYKAFDKTWRSGTQGEDPLPRPATWKQSIDSFLKAGLPLPILLNCVDRAMANTKIPAGEVFRYMCGIAWTRVRELQDAAQAQFAPAVPVGLADEPAIVQLTEDQDGCSACNGAGDLAAEVLGLFPYEEQQAAIRRARSRTDRIRVYDDDAAEAARLAVLALLMARGRQFEAVTD